jgi:two-component system, NarL family, nitrate/nitrite response regulator NarL
MEITDRFVYIVAADPLARGGLAALIADAPGWQIAGQASPEQVQAELVNLSIPLPDLLIWDTGWQPAETLPIFSAIRQDNPTLSMLLLVEDAESAVHFVAQSTDAGISGILLRSVEPERLFAAMGAVAAGLMVFEPKLQVEPDPWFPLANTVPDSPPRLPEPLTPRELDVLHLVAQGLPNKTIARRLAISEHTVKFHMNGILGKLNAQSRTQAVVNAGRAGIIQV